MTVCWIPACAGMTNDLLSHATSITALAVTKSDLLSHRTVIPIPTDTLNDESGHATVIPAQAGIHEALRVIIELYLIPPCCLTPTKTKLRKSV